MALTVFVAIAGFGALCMLLFSTALFRDPRRDSGRRPGSLANALGRLRNGGRSRRSHDVKIVTLRNGGSRAVVIFRPAATTGVARGNPSITARSQAKAR